MKLVEFYTISGGDYHEVFSRLPGDGLIQKFVNKFKEDDTFQVLLKAVDEENYEEAFRASHTLKGLCLTLGFGSLCKSASDVTELLRNYEEKNREELGREIKRLDVEYHQLIENIDKIEIE